MTLRAGFVAAICSATLLCPPAHAAKHAKGEAQAVPQGCSVGPIADRPIFGIVGSKPFVPKKASVHMTPDGMEVGGAKFDRYVLTIETDGIFNELSVDMLVPLGKKPDGRVFRVLPIDSISGQPAAAEGTPEVQGWDLELESAGVKTSFTEEVASIRVEWGVRKADALPGKIHVCVPGQHAEIMGTFTATVE